MHTCHATFAIAGHGLCNCFDLFWIWLFSCSAVKRWTIVEIAELSAQVAPRPFTGAFLSVLKSYHDPFSHRIHHSTFTPIPPHPSHPPLLNPSHLCHPTSPHTTRTTSPPIPHRHTPSPESTDSRFIGHAVHPVLYAHKNARSIMSLHRERCPIASASLARGFQLFACGRVYLVRDHPIHRMPRRPQIQKHCGSRRRQGGAGPIAPGCERTTPPSTEDSVVPAKA